MANEMWPTLKSCNHKKLNQPSELPDDVLLSILSSLPMKDAAKTSLVSHGWSNVRRRIFILNFEDPESMKKMCYKEYIIGQERSNFVRRVNQVVEQHLGAAIDEFTVTFDLDSGSQSHIDKWVDFAFAKQVKRLKLDFSQSGLISRRYATFPRGLPQNPNMNKHALMSLCLKCIDITTEDVECLLRSCPHLENLCIDRSTCLTTIRASDLSLPLKHLKVRRCSCLRDIDIFVPKLLSFSYEGLPIELHIKNASSLSEVMITASPRRAIAYVFDSLSGYFPQLEIFKLRMYVYHELNLAINYCPPLINLKHLELAVCTSWDLSLLGWVPLIEACPALQKLTIMVNCSAMKPSTLQSLRVKKREGLPLKCLKTLEIIGFVGFYIDLDLATHVLENSLVLQEVVIDFTPSLYMKQPVIGARERAMELEKMLPQGAKLIIK